MKTFWLATTCLLVGCAAAQAGDLGYPQQRRPYTVAQPLDGYSWAGPYIGGNLGYGWGSTTNNPTKPSGLNLGATAGYNFQTGAWVYGLEGDLQINSARDTFAQYKFSNPWFGTARGRLGYSFSNVLFYGTAGVAFGELRGDIPLFAESHTTAGWTVGVGVEFGFAPQWSAKIEYLYVDLSNTRFTTTGVQNGYEFGLARIGVNYHF